MNMQLFEKIDGLLGISVLALLFIALAASQADARLGEKGALNAENQAVTTATRMTKNEAPGWQPARQITARAPKSPANRQFFQRVAYSCPVSSRPFTAFFRLSDIVL